MPQGSDCVAAIIFQPLAHYRTSWFLCLFLSLTGNTDAMTVQPTNINIGSYDSKLWQCSRAPSSQQSTNLRLSPLSPFFRAFLGSKGKIMIWRGRKGLMIHDDVCCTVIYQILSWPSEALFTYHINCPQSPCSHIPRISHGWHFQ